MNELDFTFGGRIKKSIELIATYYEGLPPEGVKPPGLDDKIWLIDQVLRVLTGCPPKGENDEYKRLAGDRMGGLEELEEQ